MPRTMLIKAKPGLRIPYPENSYKYLSEADGAVAVDVDAYERLEYWQRRVDHGEADLVTQAPAEKVAAAAPAPEVVEAAPEKDKE